MSYSVFLEIKNSFKIPPTTTVVYVLQSIISTKLPWSNKNASKYIFKLIHKHTCLLCMAVLYLLPNYCKAKMSTNDNVVDRIYLYPVDYQHGNSQQSLMYRCTQLISSIKKCDQKLFKFLASVKSHQVQAKTDLEISNFSAYKLIDYHFIWHM